MNDTSTPLPFSDPDQLTPQELADFKRASRLKALEPQLGEPFLFERASGPRRGQIVAEGDSWFDYLPGTDLIGWLRNKYDYDIDNYAKAGDTLENMIFGTRIDDEFRRQIPQIYDVLRRIEALQPRVFLFSGGGNDIAGDEFASFLNHKLSGLPTFRDAFADNLIQVVFRNYFEHLIREVERRAPQTHIVTHGYGHTAPTGKGVGLFGFNFKGPWLRPALTQKAILDSQEQRAIVFGLIDQYNAMLADLAQTHPHFHHVDLRPILNPDTDWINELHLKDRAYERAADIIHQTVAPLFAAP